SRASPTPRPLTATDIWPRLAGAATLRVITRGVSYRTVGPGGEGGGRHDPLLPGQGPARPAPTGGPHHLVLRRSPRQAAPHQGAAAAGLHADRHPTLPGGGAGVIRRGPGR